MEQTQPSFLLLGAGYTLLRVAQLFGKHEVVLTTQSTEKCDALRKQGYFAEVLSIRAGGQLRDILDTYPSLSAVVDGIPPLLSSELRRSADGRNTSPGWLSEALFGVKNVAAITADYPNIEKIIYLSTTGVFGVTDGSWVDEQTPTRASSPRITARIEAENLYRATSKEVIVLRPSAIYGPERSLVHSIREGRFQLIEGDRWSNRIHVDDLAQVIRTVLVRSSSGLPHLLCVSDDEPTLVRELVNFLCARYKIAEPTPISLEEAKGKGLLTLLGNQRVSNVLLKKQLNISLNYPSFRQADVHL